MKTSMHTCLKYSNLRLQKQKIQLDVSRSCIYTSKRCGLRFIVLSFDNDVQCIPGEASGNY